MEDKTTTVKRSTTEKAKGPTIRCQRHVAGKEWASAEGSLRWPWLAHSDFLGYCHPEYSKGLLKKAAKQITKSDNTITKKEYQIEEKPPKS